MRSSKLVLTIKLPIWLLTFPKNIENNIHIAKMVIKIKQTR